MEPLKSNGTPQALSLDTRGFTALKKAAKADPNSAEFKGVVKESARQFEAVFLDMVVKGMRQSVPDGGLFDKQSSKMFEGMQDQQMVQGLSGRGVGLAAMIEKQLMKAATAYKPPVTGQAPDNAATVSATTTTVK